MYQNCKKVKNLFCVLVQVRWCSCRPNEMILITVNVEFYMIFLKTSGNRETVGHFIFKKKQEFCDMFSLSDLTH